MKTRFFIIIIISAIVVSSATTYMIVPVKYAASVYPDWIRNNMDAANKLRDSNIPIIGVDVDEKIGVLTIYMTDENSKKYEKELDNLLDVPYDVLSETESRELRCLKIYKNIREIPKTHSDITPQWHILRHQKHAVEEYTELKCPDFSDFESMKKNLKKYSFVSIPQGASIEGRTSLIPKDITIVLGINNTVTWINEDDVPHALVSDDKNNSWQTGVMQYGDSSSVTFNSTGIFEYHGEPYDRIAGKVTVLE